MVAPLNLSADVAVETEVDNQASPVQPRADPGHPLGSAASRRRPGVWTYALLLGLIALVCLATVQLIGPNASKKHFCATSEVTCSPGDLRCDGCQ
jgi:hypothetical protein